MATCNCGKRLLEPVGKGSILIVRDSPDFDEIRTLSSYRGKAADGLDKEMNRAGLSLNDCRLAYLWGHAKDEKNCNLNFHLDRLVKEMVGKTHVLLMGTDAATCIVGVQPSSMYGLMVPKHDFGKVRIWVAPTFPFRAPIGELRLALERFAQDVRKK